MKKLSQIMAAVLACILTVEFIIEKDGSLGNAKIIMKNARGRCLRTMRNAGDSAAGHRQYDTKEK